jgi:deazaflavin-dependent oxidoreductase (nitroreductase family)
MTEFRKGADRLCLKLVNPSVDADWGSWSAPITECGARPFTTGIKQHGHLLPILHMVNMLTVQFILIDKEFGMGEFDDWNKKIIEEFRSNGGKVGGPFEGGTLLLLHTIGAKSGKERINPLAYFPDGDRFTIIASKAGAPTNPDWYHNLVAHPDVTIEIGTETIPVKATVVEGEERDQLYARMVERMPGFAEYQQKTTRKIPVVALERR